MAITVTNKNFSHIIFDSEKPVLLNFSNRQSDASRKQDNLCASSLTNIRM